MLSTTDFILLLIIILGVAVYCFYNEKFNKKIEKELEKQISDGLQRTFLNLYSYKSVVVDAWNIGGIRVSAPSDKLWGGGTNTPTYQVTYEYESGHQGETILGCRVIYDAAIQRKQLSFYKVNDYMINPIIHLPKN